MLRNYLIDNSIEFQENADMRLHTTFKVGGKADFLVCPKDVNQAKNLILFLKQENIPFYFLGRGSNVIFKDEGYNGVILQTKNMCEIKINQHSVKAGAGCLLTPFCKILQENALSGLEFCYGIPGNVGGATFMNAGAYGGEISNCIESIEYLDEYGELKLIKKQDCQFRYRHSIFQNNKWLITAVNFTLAPSNKEQMLAFMEDIMQRRRDKQPLDKPSAGSSFKRPEGYFAAALIDECGLKGKTVGGAQISTKHAGFIVNIGKATCNDILTLANQVEDIILKEKGIVLEKEMIIV